MAYAFGTSLNMEILAEIGRQAINRDLTSCWAPEYYYGGSMANLTGDDFRNLLQAFDDLQLFLFTPELSKKVVNIVGQYNSNSSILISLNYMNN